MGRESFRPLIYLGFFAAMLLALALSVCLGSVSVPLLSTWKAIFRGGEGLSSSVYSIIVTVRLPRTLCVALEGMALSLCGSAMQGLLRNPLADGSILGVSSGASLGAALSIAFGLSIPFFPMGGTMGMAMLCALLSLLLVLGLAYRLDRSLATNTILLIGVIFSMFVNSILSLVVTFAGDKVKHILFWTMGSLNGSGYTDVWLLLGATLLFGGILLSLGRELNAFSLGEDNARTIGVHVKRIKFLTLVCVAALIGVCVSIGGTIGFVGLVIPHIARMLVGPNHRRLMPASLFIGATFLMLADLVSRTLLSPLELPIGVVTSMIGSVLFVVLFYRTRKAG